MRIYAGFTVIFILLPVFITSIFLSSEEIKNVKNFNRVLEERINLNHPKLSLTSYVKDRNGSVISEIYNTVNRKYIPLNEIPSFIQELMILSEDENFYNHIGFDLLAMGRAIKVNMQSDEIAQGASTITQQVARNLYLNHDQTYNRKLSELLYAYEMERTISKEKILELYLNSIYFQNGAYGIEAASRLYFQKNTKNLSKAELAFLAAIPNNPTLYDPVQHFDRTKKRQQRLIDLLAKKQFINQDEAAKIKKETIKLNLNKKTDLYPDYVTYVESELKDLISKEEGYTKKLRRLNGKDKEALEKKLSNRVNELLRSGIIIETALDPEIQQTSKEKVAQYLPYEDVEGASVVINHNKHEILAIVGGKKYEKYAFHRGFQTYRQPGSVIKPLLVYAPFFDQTNSSITDKISADSYCTNGYCPQNFGGALYGMVTIERAFMYSYNTPAVRILDQIGVEAGFNDLEHFHFKKVLKDDHVLSTAVGGFSYGMTPLELTSAYTVFANEGYYQPSRAIKKVTDLQGNTLYKWKDSKEKVWSKETTNKIRLLMQKTVQAGTAKRAYFPSSYIGGKTGTTNEFKDYWFIGLTNDLTAGVWVGKDQPESMESIQSTAPQLKIWKETIRKAEAP